MKRTGILLVLCKNVSSVTVEVRMICKHFINALRVLIHTLTFDEI